MSLPDPLGDAARWIADGGLLAYPTETFWALGAAARSQAAVDRLRRWKGRGDTAPLSVLVEDAAHARAEGVALVGSAERLASAFWPGPITLVVRAESRFAAGVANASGGVGLRCSSHPLAGALCRRLARAGAGPITATSLNRSGAPPAGTLGAARAACEDGDDAPRLLEVEGAEAGGGEPSTVVDTTCDPPLVLRWGAVDATALRTAVREWREA